MQRAEGKREAKEETSGSLYTIKPSAGVELDLEVREEQKTTTRFKALKEMKRYDRQKIKQV